MKPILFELQLPLVGAVSFPAYLTMLVVGSLAAISLVRRHGERAGLQGDADGVRMVDLGLLVLILGVVGARLLSVLTDGYFMDFVHLCTDPTRVPAVDSRVSFCSQDILCDFHYVCDLGTHTCHPPRDCLAALKFWQGGLTFYGGLLLALPGAVWFTRRYGMNIRQVADVAAPAAMLGLFFGRLGCFLNGCCYGAATDSWVGVRLPGHGAPSHPTQLYEAAVALVLFAVLHWIIQPRKRGHGEVFGWLLVLYGAIRVVIELFRADPRGSLGPLSTSQILSVPLIAAGVWLIRRARRGTPEAEASDQLLPPAA